VRSEDQGAQDVGRIVELARQLDRRGDPDRPVEGAGEVDRQQRRDRARLAGATDPAGKGS